MRILHIAPTYLPATRYGGPIYSVHGLCKSLVKLQHEVHVFTTNVNGSLDSNVPLLEPVDLEGVKVWYFPSKFLRWLYYSQEMNKTLSRNVSKFDLIHLHSIYLWPMWAAARAAEQAGIPYIVSPRGMLVKELIKRKNRLLKSIWIRLIEKRNLENAAGIHATSKLEAEEIECFNFKFPPIFIIPNGIDEEVVDLKESVQSTAVTEVTKKKPLILFFGRINWKKGLDRLIPAMSYVPNAHLAIAGNDEENYTPFLEKLAVQHSVRNQITFIGPVYDKDKIALLKNANVFVLPSYSENFGNTVLEAMAAGCPAIVTPEVGLADTIKKLGAGLVIEGTPRVLGESLRSLLSDPVRRQQMGAAGQKAARDHFAWGSVAQQMEKVYREILSRKLEPC